MTKTGKIILGIVVIVVVIGLIYLGVTKQPSGPATGEPIKIGWVGPLTGDAVSYGEPVKNGVALAVEEINNLGGINGRPIKIIYEDGFCSGKNAVSAVQKLINVDNVKIIIGGVCSGETLSMAPLTEVAQILVISAAASNPDISKAGDFVFRNTPSDEVGGKGLATLIRDKYTKVAIISESTDYAQGNKRVFEETFKSLGGEIVKSEDYTPGIKDFRASLTKIKDSGAQALLINPQTEIAGGDIINQAKELRIFLPLYANAVLAGEKTLEITGLNSEGLVVVDVPGLNKDNKLAQEFLNKYNAKYGSLSFPFYAGAAYDDVYLLKEAISKVGLDTPKLRDYLYGLKDFKGVIGNYSFDKNGDLAGLGFEIKQVKEGKLVGYVK